MVRPCGLCSDRPGSQVRAGDAGGQGLPGSAVTRQSPVLAVRSGGAPRSQGGACRAKLQTGGSRRVGLASRKRGWRGGQGPVGGGWDRGFWASLASVPHFPEAASSCPGLGGGDTDQPGTGKGQCVVSSEAGGGGRAQGGSDVFAPGFSGTPAPRRSAGRGPRLTRPPPPPPGRQHVLPASPSPETPASSRPPLPPAWMKASLPVGLPGRPGQLPTNIGLAGHQTLPHLQHVPIVTVGLSLVCLFGPHVPRCPEPALRLARWPRRSGS